MPWLVPVQGRRHICKSRGAGMLLGVYMQIFGYSPLKIQVTVILLDRTNLKLGGSSPPKQLLATT